MMPIKSLFLSTILASAAAPLSAATNVLAFEAETITGTRQGMQDFAGQVLVIVNTASRCGFTRQYRPLVELQKQYAERGVTVIGFPSGDFGGQELATNAEIATFCESNFGVNFPLMAKTSVKGPNQDALFAYLTSAPNPDFTGNIRWNFEKFLIDRKGVLRRRFRSRTAPDSETFRQALDELVSVTRGGAQPGDH